MDNKPLYERPRNQVKCICRRIYTFPSGTKLNSRRSLFPREKLDGYLGFLPNALHWKILQPSQGLVRILRSFIKG